MAFTVAIAGISSKLARLAANELLKRPDVRLRGSCRDTGKLPNNLRESPRVSLFQAEPYDTKTLRSLIHGCDVVVCCYFAEDEVMLNGQKLLIDLCEEENITRYIASDYTGDYTKLDWGDLAIKEPMKHVKSYLESKTTVNGVHILVGLLMETFLDFFDIYDAKSNRIRYWGTGNEKWDLTSYQTAAEYVAAVTLDQNATGLFKFRGDHKSALELADDVKSLHGTQPDLETRGPLADLALRLDGAGNTQDIISAGTYFTLSGKIALGDNLDNARYPDVKPETFSAVLSRHFQ
ncbi:NmrA family protein-like protein [Paraphoma chrysanthemicola]|nr:NmrA family protein-like protein [Paraphoma chrysanthemicola]